MKYYYIIASLVASSFTHSDAFFSPTKSTLGKRAKARQMERPITFAPFPEQDTDTTRSISALKSLRAGDDGIQSLIPSTVFLAFAAVLVKLVTNILDSNLQHTVGVLTLFFTSVTVAYDNFIIGIGKPLFGDAGMKEDGGNEVKQTILKALSFPRFTAHAVFVPFLFTTVAEIGKNLGISWLESSKIQLIMIIGATIVGVYSRIQFVRGKGIVLAKEDDLVWFTYKVSTH